MPNGVAAELRKLYYDTASAASPGIDGCVTHYGAAGHILFGTDYPFVRIAVGIEHFQASKRPDTERHAIDRDNAIALLPRLKRRQR